LVAVVTDIFLLPLLRERVNMHKEDSSNREGVNEVVLDFIIANLSRESHLPLPDPIIINQSMYELGKDGVIDFSSILTHLNLNSYQFASMLMSNTKYDLYRSYRRGYADRMRSASVNIGKLASSADSPSAIKAIEYMAKVEARINLNQHEHEGRMEIARYKERGANRRHRESLEVQALRNVTSLSDDVLQDKVGNNNEDE
jgi:hypothetical protein